MNPTLSAFARQQLKEGLAKLNPENHRMFKLMYSHKDLEKPIDDVVDAMPDDKLDWAMQQVERSVAKAENAA
jgi:hypothetical protein